MSAPISVLVELKGHEVHTQELVATPDGLALNPHAVFSSLGTVRQIKIPGKRGFLSVWRWESDGYQGDMGTKAAAITKMLTDAGYVEAKLTATIPPLFGDLP